MTVLAHDASTGTSIGGGEIEPDPNGPDSYGFNLVDAGQVTDDATLELSDARSVTTMEIDGTPYLFVASYWDDGVPGVQCWR